MTDDTNAADTDQATAEHRAPDAFATVANLLTLIASPRECKSRLAELQREIKRLDAVKVAATDAQAKVAEAKAELETLRAKWLTSFETEKDELYELQVETIAKNAALADREARIFALEDKWKFVGEDPMVVSGFQSPSSTAVAKARKAYGLDQDDAPPPDPHFGITVQQRIDPGFELVKVAGSTIGRG